MNSIEILSTITSCFHQITTDYGLPLSLLLAGLVGSATHCVVMCGPFVMSQSGDMKKLRHTALIPYHLGRMVTYVFLAVLAHTVLSLVFVYSDLKAFITAPMLLLAAVIFIVSAFPQMRIIFPWAGGLSLRLSETFKAKHLKNLMAPLISNPGTLSKFGLGVLLGFMPCGLVVAALIASAAAPSLPIAMISMAAFAFGTMPALILVAMGGAQIVHRYPKFSYRFSQFAKVTSAVWLCALAGTLVL